MAEMFIKETAAVWAEPAGGGQRASVAAKMDLEGRLVAHLPAGHFIKQVLPRGLCPILTVALPSCVVISPRPSPDF